MNRAERKAAERRIEALQGIDGPLEVDEAQELRRLEFETRMHDNGFERDRRR